eukprot:1177727-Prorocentrum_minimum.AAC.7
MLFGQGAVGLMERLMLRCVYALVPTMAPAPAAEPGQPAPDPAAAAAAAPKYLAEGPGQQLQ